MPVPPLSGGTGDADAPVGGIPPGAGEGRAPAARGGRRRAAAGGGERRSRVVKPRFSEAELVMIRAVAAQCGWSVRGWLGQVAVAAGGPRMPVAPPSFHRPQVRIVRECWWQVRRVEVLAGTAANWAGDAAALQRLVDRCANAGGWGQLLVDQLTADDEVVVRLAAFQAADAGGRVGRRARGSEPRIKVDVDVTDAEWSELAASAQGADLSVPAWVTAVTVAAAGLAASSASGDTGGLIGAAQRVRSAGQMLNATVAQMYRGGEVPPRMWKEIQMADEQVSQVTNELEKLLAKRGVGQGREPLIDMTQPPKPTADQNAGAPDQ